MELDLARKVFYSDISNFILFSLEVSMQLQIIMTKIRIHHTKLEFKFLKIHQNLETIPREKSHKTLNYFLLQSFRSYLIPNNLDGNQQDCYDTTVTAQCLLQSRVYLIEFNLPEFSHNSSKFAQSSPNRRILVK